MGKTLVEASCIFAFQMQPVINDVLIIKFGEISTNMEWCKFTGVHGSPIDRDYINIMEDETVKFFSSLHCFQETYIHECCSVK